MTEELLELYLWLDAETTGINPEEHDIIEVAFMLTSGPGTTMQPVGTHHSFLVVPDEGEVTFREEAEKMHKITGLFDEYRSAVKALEEGQTLPNVRSFSEADQFIVEEIESAVMHAHDRDLSNVRIYLAGRNPQFDRAYIDKSLPMLASLLHYRVFDVTTLLHIDESLNDFDHGVVGRDHRAIFDLLRDHRNSQEFIRRYKSSEFGK